MKRSVRRAALRLAAIGCAIAALAGCLGGGGGGSSESSASSGSPQSPASSTSGLSGQPLPAAMQPTTAEASRFLAQSTFGPTSTEEIDAVRTYGYDAWLAWQTTRPAASHVDYVRSQLARTDDGRPREEMSYEAVWQQWLYGEDQLRARVAFALGQIFVISNIAPDLNTWAMSSYMDMLNRNAFGNYRQLLEDVTLHPAMGYYLNMLRSEKEDLATGRHPNENYAREILQLFSVGLFKLNPDGSRVLVSGQPVPTYGEDVVQGFAKAFTGWSFGGGNTASNDAFYNGEENWLVPMQPWSTKHSSGTKLLLNGRVLPAGQAPAQDMKDALDNVFNHPNVGPFIARRLIQRLVTSNPTPAYIGRVAAVFNDNGAGVRGDLRAVVRAILLDAEARDVARAADPTFGKQREPVIRFANLLRGLNARSANGRNDIHYLDSAENGLGQSPLLAPSVFNFFAPDYKAPGAITTAGLVSPEFQITTETSVVGALNFFADLVYSKGYGSEASRLVLDYTRLEALSATPAALADWLNVMFMNNAMSASFRASLVKAVTAIPAAQKTDRVKAALILVSVAPDFVIQR